MNKQLSSSAQLVQNILQQKGLTCEVVELPTSTRTAQEAATSLGCTLAQIVKSLVFKTVTSGKPILILASGPNRINEQIIEKQIGEKIVKADADFVRQATGFAIGGIPPTGHKLKIQTFIDEDLLKLNTVWAAAGTPNAVFCLQASALPMITDGIIISLSAPDTLK
jgi:prolyl-tRNA editing enzyme YbaK/EbsC (Cys-tRNA(Pro) deacylase)